MNERRKDALDATAAKNATDACNMAMNTFTLDAMGASCPEAGGTRAKQNRFDVIGRLSRHLAGLSPAQRNDFQWWKETWDDAMISEHRANWAATLAGWVQHVLDSGALHPNVFSICVYNEANRVLHKSKALVLPGS